MQGNCYTHCNSYPDEKGRGNLEVKAQGIQERNAGGKGQQLGKEGGDKGKDGLLGVLELLKQNRCIADNYI